MISTPKLALELALIVAALALMRDAGAFRRQRFVLIFTGIAVALNLVFYYAAAWPLYTAHGDASGIGHGSLHAMVLVDVFKWGLLAYVLARLAAALQDAGLAGGFALLRPGARWGGVVATGLLAAVIATAAIYGLSHAEHRLGWIEGVPWPQIGRDPAYLKLGLWGGLRNLAGEEILARLGVQAILLRAWGKRRGGAVLAAVLSAFVFELWHSGFREIYFLNFAASLAFAWAYHRRGYESAAIGHCVADWLAIVVLPRLFY